MIKPKCDKCSDELTEFGGIYLSPPSEELTEYLIKGGFKFNGMVVIKSHLCTKCDETIKNDFALVDVSKPKLTCKCGRKTHNLNNGLCYPCWDMVQ